MRMMVTIRVPAAPGSRALVDGTMAKTIEKVLGKIKPECAYFFLENGKRTMRAVFPMQNNSDTVPFFEPAIMNLDAEVEVIPVMSAEELHAGFAAVER
jgi:hypothetical protein